MAAWFRSLIMSKVILLVAVAVAALLFSRGYAQEAPPPPPPAYKYPPCETLGVPLPECQSWCNKMGFLHGGYLKADVCCCMS